MNRVSTKNFERIENESDNLHCLQACLIMVHQMLSGYRLSMATAEKATGFKAGKETWPYAMIAWLAENGYEIVHIDAIDPLAMCANPEAELRRIGTSDELIHYFLQITDFREIEEDARRGLATGRVRYDTRIPDFADVVDGIADGYLPALTVDLGVLGEMKGEFQGHIIVATGAGGDQVEVQDPGPPARWDWLLSGEELVRAMRSPSETAGTATLVRLGSPMIR